MSNRLDLKTPVGRLVMGNVAVPNPTDMHGKPRDKPQYFFALAVAKTDPEVNGIIGQIMNYAFTAYAKAPEIQQRMQAGLVQQRNSAQGFAWKIDDGDDPKHAQKEGCAGHWIFKFATTLPIRCCDGQNQQMDPANVKLGWFADVGFSVAINDNVDHTAGIYLNPSVCRVLGYAPEIVTGPSIDQVMGAAPAQLPPGASSVPVAPGGAPAPQYPPQGAPAPQYPPQGAPAPQYPGQAPAPQYPGQAPAPQYPGQAPAAPQPGFTPQVPQGASAPAVPAYAPPAPSAPSTPAHGSQATAYPSNPVQPYPGFLTPPGGQQ